MKRIILLFLVLAFSIWFGLRISADPGYVLIAYKKWTMEMPLWLTAVTLFFTFIAFHAALRLFAYTGSISGNIKLFFKNRKRRAARSRTARGLIAFTEGMWGIAEHDLVKAIPSSDIPLINYLAAARAAQEQGEIARRDTYLRKALKCDPEAKIAVELTQAQLQMANQQFEQALATLRHLQQLAPNHRYVLKQLSNLYLQMKDWNHLLSLLPQLRRQKILTEDDFDALAETVYIGWLQQKINSGSINELLEAWKKIPRAMHQNLHLLAIYTQGLLQLNALAHAEEIIRTTLKKYWSSRLAYLYGLTDSGFPEKQLKVTEMWLRDRPNNPELLLSAGRLAKRNKLWGKARSYFENCIAIKPSPEAYAELASILEEIQTPDLAQKCYRDGLLNATGDLGE